MTIVLPDQRWIGCILIGIGFLVFFLDIKFDRGSIKHGNRRFGWLLNSLRRRILAFIVITILGSVVAVLAAICFWPTDNLDHSVLPLAWSRTIGVTGGGSGDDFRVREIDIFAINESSSEVTFDGAYMRSLTDGSEQLMNARTNDRDIRSDKINPIPPGVRLVLSIAFDEKVPVREFLKRWSHLSFSANYGGKQYNRIFDISISIERLIEATRPPRNPIPEPSVTPRETR